MKILADVLSATILFAVPLLALYNGQRGKWRIGGLFYFYYPAHLAVIYGIALLLRRPV